MSNPLNYLTADEGKCAERCRKIWEEAAATYQLPEDIKFVLKFQSKLQVFHGARNKKSRRAVGKAHYDRETRVATVTLNRDAIVQNLPDMLDDTIPHEVAHVVCMVNISYGNDHDQGWQSVCKRLGGSGDHRYSYGDYDMRIRKRHKYIYDVPGMGGPRRVSDVKHKLMQSGQCGFRDSISGISIRKEHWTGEVV